MLVRPQVWSCFGICVSFPHVGRVSGLTFLTLKAGRQVLFKSQGASRTGCSCPSFLLCYSSWIKLSFILRCSLFLAVMLQVAPGFPCCPLGLSMPSACDRTGTFTLVRWRKKSFTELQPESQRLSIEHVCPITERMFDCSSFIIFFSCFSVWAALCSLQAKKLQWELQNCMHRISYTKTWPKGVYEPLRCDESNLKYFC